MRWLCIDLGKSNVHRLTLLRVQGVAFPLTFSPHICTLPVVLWVVMGWRLCAVSVGK
jgi:hypothetical protein